MFVALANLAGSEGGKMFSGASLIAGPKGDVASARRCGRRRSSRCRSTSPISRARAPTCRCSPTSARRCRTSWRAWSSPEPREAPGLAFDPPSENGDHALVHPDVEPPARGPLRVVQVAPIEGAGGPPPLDIDGALTEKWLVHFIQEEVRRRGFSKGIIGLSGGVDSAVTAYLAARALGPRTSSACGCRTARRARRASSTRSS